MRIQFGRRLGCRLLMGQTRVVRKHCYEWRSGYIAVRPCVRRRIQMRNARWTACTTPRTCRLTESPSESSWT